MRFATPLSFSRSIALLTMAVLPVVSSQSLAADDKPAKKGCEYKFLSPGGYGGKSFQNPPQQLSENGYWTGQFDVKYGQNTIAGCQTNLRSYNGQLVGTTIRIKPGDTIQLKLNNLLPVDDSPMPEDINTPHNFNVTNFHVHGLHVSPAGNSDNVLINIHPQTSWDVEITVPKDHPTGTFWYHAHVHGSTALQVSSGMAGAIIIENPDDPKSLDSLPVIQSAKEEIFLLQQIAYDDQGEIEDYGNLGFGTVNPDSPYGPGSWAQTGRLPTVNGQVYPEIVMQPGEIRRWRFIHGGVRESYMLGVVDTDLQPGDDDYAWTLNEIAVDGLALGYMNGWKTIEMQPGYRSDVLVKAPSLKKGETEKIYFLMDQASTAADSLQNTAEAQQVIAKIVVRGDSVDMDLPCKANKSCKAMKNMRPHANVTDKELDGAEQSVDFNIAARLCSVEGEPCTESCDPNSDENCKTRFMINNIPFSSKNVRTMTLGKAAEWTLSSSRANHPFHIHVNPFQVSRENPLGKQETIWRDTLMIKAADDPVKVRTRYERYIGQFVIHCHILDHEDQGMMQIVEIVPPGNSSHH